MTVETTNKKKKYIKKLKTISKIGTLNTILIQTVAFKLLNTLQ